MPGLPNPFPQRAVARLEGDDIIMPLALVRGITSEMEVGQEYRIRIQTFEGDFTIPDPGRKLFTAIHNRMVKRGS